MFRGQEVVDVGSAVSRQRVTASVVPAPDRFEFWEQSVANRVYPMRLHPLDLRTHPGTQPFRADFMLVEASGARVSTGVLGPLRSETTTAQAAQRDGDLVHIGFRPAGRMRLDSRQGAQTFTGGTLVLESDDEPNSHTYLDQVPLVLLSVEAAKLSVPVDRLRAAMMVPIATDAALRALMVGVGEVARRATPSLDTAGMSSYLTGVAELVLRTVLGTQPDHAGTADARRAQARAVVRDRLADPHLTAGVVAQQVGVSPRRLHQLFSGGPSVAEQIRTARMELAARLLRDPLWADQPVGAVGLRCGFVDASQFARSFRRWAGGSPSEFRAARVQIR